MTSCSTRRTFHCDERRARRRARRARHARKPRRRAPARPALPGSGDPCRPYPITVRWGSFLRPPFSFSLRARKCSRISRALRCYISHVRRATTDAMRCVNRPLDVPRSMFSRNPHRMCFVASRTCFVATRACSDASRTCFVPSQTCFAATRACSAPREVASSPGERASLRRERALTRHERALVRYEPTSVPEESPRSGADLCPRRPGALRDDPNEHAAGTIVLPADGRLPRRRRKRCRPARASFGRPRSWCASGRSRSAPAPVCSGPAPIGSAPARSRSATAPSCSATERARFVAKGSGAGEDDPAPAAPGRASRVARPASSVARSASRASRPASSRKEAARLPPAQLRLRRKWLRSSRRRLAPFTRQLGPIAH